MSAGSEATVARATFSPTAAHVAARSHYLLIVGGRHVGRLIPITADVVIGRGDCCDIRLADTEISRQHARLDRTADDTLTIADLGSANGTFLNDVRISDPSTLQDGDRLHLGNTTALKFACLGPANATVEAAIRQHAARDFTTGALNEHYFVDRLEHLYACARNALTPLTLLYVEVDAFEVFRKLYGPQRCEILLAALAHRLRPLIGAPDLLARIGDILAIGHWNATVDQAVDLARRLQGAVRNEKLPISSRELVDVSISVALATHDVPGRPSATSLVAEAELALTSTVGPKRIIVAGRHA